MSFSFETYKNHLHTIESLIEREAQRMGELHTHLKTQTDAQIHAIDSLISRAQMAGVDYALIDTQFRAHLEGETKPFIDYLKRMRERTRTSLTHLHSAHEELHADFSKIGSQLPASIANLAQRAEKDLELAEKDEQFLDRTEKTIERLFERLVQLAEGFIKRDIARAERHHRPDDTPLKHDMERLSELTTKLARAGHMISNRARLAHVHLTDAHEMITQELEGIDAWEHHKRAA